MTQRHASFPTHCSRLIREDSRKTRAARSLRAAPFGPLGTCSRLRCQAAAPYGSLASVFCVHITTPLQCYSEARRARFARSRNESAECEE